MTRKKIGENKKNNRNGNGNLIGGIVKFIRVIAKVVNGTKNRVDEIKTDNKRPRKNAIFERFEEIDKFNGLLEEFENKIYESKSSIGLILGARGSGKSAIGMKILENVKVKTNKKIYAMGFSKGSLPIWIIPIYSLSEIKNNSFLLVDEGGIEFSSRNSLSSPNKLLSGLLLIARHKDLSVLFISQNSSNIEINTIRQSDYLILKRPSLLQMDFERKKIKEIYSAVVEQFKKNKEEGLTYIYSDEYRGFIINKLPSFWGNKISKSYSKK